VTWRSWPPGGLAYGRRGSTCQALGLAVSGNGNGRDPLTIAVRDLFGAELAELASASP
jgi:hypothetical protein